MTLGKFLEDNLWAILSAGVIGLLTFVIGTTQTNGTIVSLTNRVEAVEQRAVENSKFNNCARIHIDRLETGSGPPPCRLEDM